MADTPVVHIGENSPEQVAFKLFREIANAESMTLLGSRIGSTQKPAREWILNTYRECLYAVTHPKVVAD
jgi:hypothetical protein